MRVGGGGARALAYACASVALLIQHATRRRIAICGLSDQYYARRYFAVETDSADYYQTGPYFVFTPISYYYAAQTHYYVRWVVAVETGERGVKTLYSVK